MRRLGVAVLVFLGLLQGVAGYGQSSGGQATGGDDEVLTNESVVKLVQSGVGSSLIVKMIEEQPNTFHLGSASVIQLKQKGVPQSVISAMLSKKAGGAAEAPGASGAGASAGGSRGAPSSRQVAPNYAWNKVEKTDPITSKQTFAVMLDTPAMGEDGEGRQGTFEATATCNAAATTLKILFASDATPALGFKQNSETYLVPGGLAGALTMASHHQKPWTVTRVRVGEGEGRQVTSEDDYKNATDLYFNVPQPRTQPANQDEAGLRALLQFASFIGPNKPAGETEELFGAKALLLEMELENGVKTLLTLRPQDAVFQTFAERCRKLEPEQMVASNAGAGREIRPPDRSGAATSGGGARGDVPRANAPAPPPLVQRFAVPAGAQLTMTVQEDMDLNGVRAYQMVHAVLTQPMQAGGQSGGAGTAYVTLGAGTEIFLRCGAAAGMGDRLNVRLELDHAVVHGMVIPLRSEMQMRQASRGVSVSSRAASLGSLAGVRLPQSHTPPDPVVVKAKEQLLFSTSQMTYAPMGFKP